MAAAHTPPGSAVWYDGDLYFTIGPLRMPAATERGRDIVRTRA